MCEQEKEDQLVRESIREQYESFDDNLETPEYTYRLLKSLRTVHNYYSRAADKLKVGPKERLAKKAKEAGYLTMGAAKHALNKK